MPRSSAFLVALALLFTSAICQAQGSRGGRPFGGRGMNDSLVSLAGSSQVQEEIQMTDRQRELLEALQNDLGDQRRNLFRRGFEDSPSGPQDDNRNRFDKMRDKVRSLNQQGDELMKMVLDSQQVERLGQLRMQREGARALDREEVAKALGLKDSQRETIREVRQSEQDRFQAGDISSRERREIREQIEADTIAVLTDDQKQLWKKMRGTTFEFPERFARRNRGGGYSGRGRGNRGQRPSRPDGER